MRLRILPHTVGDSVGKAGMQTAALLVLGIFLSWSPTIWGKQSSLVRGRTLLLLLLLVGVGVVADSRVNRAASRLVGLVQENGRLSAQLAERFESGVQAAEWIGAMGHIASRADGQWSALGQMLYQVAAQEVHEDTYVENRANLLAVLAQINNIGLSHGLILAAIESPKAEALASRVVSRIHALQVMVRDARLPIKVNMEILGSAWMELPNLAHLGRALALQAFEAARHHALAVHARSGGWDPPVSLDKLRSFDDPTYCVVEERRGVGQVSRPK